MRIRDFLLLGMLLLWLMAVIFYLWKKRKEGKCIGCAGGDCGACGRKEPK